MATKQLYECSLRNCSYFFKNGKQAAFILSKYATDVETEVAELNSEIKLGHPHISYAGTIDTDADTPEKIMEKKIRAKIEAEMAAKVATDKTNDMGSSDQSGKLQGIASSVNTADGVAAADSGVTLASLKDKLANLASKSPVVSTPDSNQ